MLSKLARSSITSRQPAKDFSKGKTEMLLDWNKRFFLTCTGLLVLLSASQVFGAELVSSTVGSRSCPGDSVVFNCTRESTVHQWLVNNVADVLLNADLLNMPRDSVLEQPFTYLVTQVIGEPATALISTASVVSSFGLDGTVVTCRNGGLGSGDPDPQTATLLVFDTTPGNLAFEQSTPSSGRLSWTLPTGSESCVSNYTVNIEGVSMFTTTDMFLDVTTGPSLLVNTSYSYNVTSNPGGTTSATKQFEIVNIEPQTSPTDLSLVVSTGDMCRISSVIVNWTAPDITANIITTPDATSYLVTCPDGLCDTATVTDTTHTITTNGIAAGTYTVTVTARNSAGSSPQASMMFDVFATTISSSSTADATSAVISPINFSNSRCTGNGNQVLRCVVQRCDNGVVEYNETTQNNQFDVNDLLPGNRYCYRITLTVDGLLVGAEDNSFTTNADLSTNEAILLRISGSTATFECRNPVYGFDGTSRQTVAVFNQATQQYDIPSCSVLIAIPVVIVIVVILIVAIVIAIIIAVYIKKRNDGKDDTKCLRETSDRKSPSPENPGLYADPNTIERQVAPGTSDEYAMVDVKSKKNKNSKPTQPEALYQDPNAIEHETAPSGDTYAVVDKPKRGSSKKKEPDVVPGPSDGLTYADIDVAGNRHRPNPASQRQAQQPVGSVEYSDVKFKEEAQL